MAGIYIHIPFCRQACHYCDFHFVTSAKNKSKVLECIAIESEKNSGFFKGEKPDSLYFGGGTPSILDIRELEFLLSVIQDNFNFLNPEITVEANPDDLTKEKISELKSLGVNRLSIGVQSFFDDDLQLLNRAHDADMARRCLSDACRAGFDNISVDLIYGLPGSTLERWLSNLEMFYSYDIPHLSAYALTYEPKTAFGNWLKSGVMKELPENEVIDQFNLLVESCRDRKYDQYEISNFCRDGKYSRHNTSYWMGHPYLGLGPSAHSYDGRTRRWNLSNNRKYIEAIENDLPSYEEELLSLDNRYNEYVMTSLRTIWGCDLNQINVRFGKEYSTLFIEEARPYIENLSLEQVGDQVILTEKGKLVADKISSDLFAL